MANLILNQKLVYVTDTQLSSLMIQELLKQIKVLPTEDGKVNNNDDSMRSSKISWLSWNHWIAGIIHNLFITANNDYFEYDLNHFDSGLQVTTYSKGDHYTWHCDGRGGDTPEGMERKLSMSLLLTDEYSGGELEIEHCKWKKVFKPKAGNAVIFPAWLAHRVKPVESGKRVSIVTWLNGPNFK